jgi:nickel-dependent lactate racemase
MNEMNKAVKILFDKSGMVLNVPVNTTVLEGQIVKPCADVETSVLAALDNPIGTAPLAQLIMDKKPQTVAITISDITRPVPNRQFLPAIMQVLNQNGIADSQIVIIVGTGMHRASTRQEHEILVGTDIVNRIEVIDHQADNAKTMLKISKTPPVSVCKRFAEADFRIVTGFIEAHFMAGFSGGRKGVCPALVDLETIQDFHGYHTLANPYASTGNLTNNPCHKISLKVAKKVGVDFLFNVIISRDKQIASIYCGNLELAHRKGCRQVKEWMTASFDHQFDLVITNGGGYPLDYTFYQTVKGMCTALPALSEHTTLLVVSSCHDQIGSETYTELMLRYDNDWENFLLDIGRGDAETKLDQWQYQMQAKVLDLIGKDKLCLVTDGIPQDIQKHLSVTPVLGTGDAQVRTQRFIDEYLSIHPRARVAIIPDGPYTMLKAAR